jgi:hypothetical protein
MHVYIWPITKVLLLLLFAASASLKFAYGGFASHAEHDNTSNNTTITTNTEAV